jgi:hypothetical protein
MRKNGEISGVRRRGRGRRTGLTLTFLENHEVELVDMPHARCAPSAFAVSPGAAYPLLLSSPAACLGQAPTDVDAGRRSLLPTSGSSVWLQRLAP